MQSLPGAVSSFLGREREIGELAEVLESERLVTLTGPPGIGKTRLGLKVAGELANGARFPDAAALAELAAFADPALLPGAVASAVGVAEVAGLSRTDALVAHLRRKRMLLVLDNCEHVIGACAGLVDTLLRACPDLVVLATSRESLGLTGERVWEVRQLTVPPPGESDPVTLMGYESVALFVERARSAKPGFVLGEDEDVAPVVAELARRLEGIPLAIELAAARVGVLTPAEISARLDDRFAVLRRARGNGPPRHQTLQAALDWSHHLLGDRERSLLRRLSVFVDGFCLEAAEAVCGGQRTVAPDDVLDLLERLVSKSLVVSNTANSRGRYRLLETIRAYAADRLEESGEAPALHERHAGYYLGLAEEAEPKLTGASQEKWFDRLEGERQNLRFALQWSLGHGRTDWALRLGGALVLFWRVRCHFSEGRELLEASLAAADRVVTRERATALWGAGFLALMGGEPDAAEGHLQDALDAFRELGDQSGIARCLLILGNRRWDVALLEESAAVALRAGDTWCEAHALSAAGHAHGTYNRLRAARPLFERGIAVSRTARDKQGLRYGLLGLGHTALMQGDYASAERLLEDAREIAVELGEDYVEASALTDLGQLALARGDYPTARNLLESAQTILPEVAPVGSALKPMILLARVAHADGDRDRALLLLAQVWQRARRLPVLAMLYRADLAFGSTDLENARRQLGRVLEFARPQGDDWLVARALHGQGHLARREGDCKRATAVHNEALEMQFELGDMPGVAGGLEAIGGVRATTGRSKEAGRLLAAAQALRERGGYARLPWEVSAFGGDVAAVRAALSSEEFDVAWAAGEALTLADAVTLALKGRRGGSRPSSGWGSLTDSEKQLAALVAEGLTNRQLGERLFMSPATVKPRLSQIYAKLGVGGRTELAREFSRHERGRDGAEG